MIDCGKKLTFWLLGFGISFAIATLGLWVWQSIIATKANDLVSFWIVIGIVFSSVIGFYSIGGLVMLSILRQCNPKLKYQIPSKNENENEGETQG